MHEAELNQPMYFDWFYTAWGYRDLYGSIPEVGQRVYSPLTHSTLKDITEQYYGKGNFLDAKNSLRGLKSG